MTGLLVPGEGHAWPFWELESFQPRHGQEHWQLQGD